MKLNKIYFFFNEIPFTLNNENDRSNKSRVTNRLYARTDPKKSARNLELAADVSFPVLLQLQVRALFRENCIIHVALLPLPQSSCLATYISLSHTHTHTHTYTHTHTQTLNLSLSLSVNFVRPGTDWFMNSKRLKLRTEKRKKKERLKLERSRKV